MLEYAWFLVVTFFQEQLVCLCTCASVPRLLIITCVIWTPDDWLNNFCNFYGYLQMVSLVAMALELKSVIETNLVRLCQCCKRSCFHINSCLKQLYICNKMEHFIYKSGSDIYFSRCLKEEMAWAINRFGLLVM